jgi:small subunit ribosomal protein S20
MANTTSAKKATRKIERRTEINKARRSRMRTYVRGVEEAIAAGDKTAALAALRAASRKVSRLSHRVAKLG